MFFDQVTTSKPWMSGSLLSELMHQAFHPHVSWSVVFVWKRFRWEFFPFFLLSKCHWRVSTCRRKLAVANLSERICKQLTFPSPSWRKGGEAWRQALGGLTNIPTCIHNVPFKKKKTKTEPLPLHWMRCIWLIAQRIPSVLSLDYT